MSLHTCGRKARQRTYKRHAHINAAGGWEQSELRTLNEPKIVNIVTKNVAMFTMRNKVVPTNMDKFRLIKTAASCMQCVS